MSQGLMLQPSPAPPAHRHRGATRHWDATSHPGSGGIPVGWGKTDPSSSPPPQGGGTPTGQLPPRAPALPGGPAPSRGGHRRPPGDSIPRPEGCLSPPPLRGGVTTDPPPSSRGGAALRRWGVSIRRAPPRLHPPRRGQRREGPGSAAARRGLSGTFRRPGPAPGGTRHWGGGGNDGDTGHTAGSTGAAVTLSPAGRPGPRQPHPPRAGRGGGAGGPRRQGRGGAAGRGGRHLSVPAAPDPHNGAARPRRARTCRSLARGRSPAGPRPPPPRGARARPVPPAAGGRGAPRRSPPRGAERWRGGLAQPRYRHSPSRERFPRAAPKQARSSRRPRAVGNMVAAGARGAGASRAAARRRRRQHRARRCSPDWSRRCGSGGD